MAIDPSRRASGGKELPISAATTKNLPGEEFFHPMTRVGLQLFTVEEPTPEAVRLAADAGYEGVEFAYEVERADPDAVRRAIDDTNMDLVGAHVTLEQLEERLEETARFYSSIGVDTIVLAYLDDSHFEDENAIEETASALQTFATAFSDRGLHFCYHNHDHEFHEIDGRTAIEALVEHTDDVDIELDVEHVAKTGVSGPGLLERLEGRVPVVHVGDASRSTGEATALGEGDAEVSECVRAAAEAGTEWFVYEGEEANTAFSDAASFIRRSLETR